MDGPVGGFVCRGSGLLEQLRRRARRRDCRCYRHSRLFDDQLSPAMFSPRHKLGFNRHRVNIRQQKLYKPWGLTSLLLSYQTFNPSLTTVANVDQDVHCVYLLIDVVYLGPHSLCR
jgi:hypothetical protein